MLTESTFFVVRRAARLRQEELAKRLGVTRTYLSQIENGKKEPSENLLQRLRVLTESLRLNEPIGQLVGVRTVRTVPVISWARAGEAASFEEIPVDWQDRIPTDCPDEKAFALTIDGDSMEPSYRSGDIVVVMPSQRPRSHGPVVARLTDRGVRFKMLTLRRGPRPFHLSSYNQIYPPDDYRESDFDWIYPVYEMRRLAWK